VKILKALAWLGLGFLALGIFFSFVTSIAISLDQIAYIGSVVAGYAIAWFFAMLGTFLMFLGGFFAKPRYLWIGAISIGILYISSFYELILALSDEEHLSFYLPFLIIALAPGLACIIGGMIIKQLSNRSKA